MGREGSSESEEKQWTMKVHGTVVSNKARNGESEKLLVHTTLHLHYS